MMKRITKRLANELFRKLLAEQDKRAHEQIKSHFHALIHANVSRRRKMDALLAKHNVSRNRPRKCIRRFRPTAIVVDSVEKMHSIESVLKQKREGGDN